MKKVISILKRYKIYWENDIVCYHLNMALMLIKIHWFSICFNYGAIAQLGERMTGILSQAVFLFYSGNDSQVYSH